MAATIPTVGRAVLATPLTPAAFQSMEGWGRPTDVGDSRYDDGMRVRREVLGDEHVDRASGHASEFTRPWQEHITASAWGEVWGRPGLDRRTRSAVTLAVLTALGRREELAIHVRGALRNGLTPEEIREVLIHVSVYAGVPAANAAFAIADEVLGASS
jgi:4-carboxymuconolactone decarboxylase